MIESLWEFASRCYAKPGVAEYCLASQDRVGADVNLLLAAAWLAAQGKRWRRDDVVAVIALCSDWRGHCVMPLRAVRRYLKEHAFEDAIYQNAKTLELQAETVQLRIIESALQHLPACAGGSIRPELLAANLQAYADAAGLSGLPKMDELVAALIANPMKEPFGQQ